MKGGWVTGWGDGKMLNQFYVSLTAKKSCLIDGMNRKKIKFKELAIDSGELNKSIP